MLLQGHQKRGKLQILTQNIYLLVVYLTKPDGVRSCDGRMVLIKA